MTKNRIIEGIDELFGDPSVPPETTLEELEEIADVVHHKIECLHEHLQKKK